MLRVDGKQKIIGIRTNCSSGKEREVELGYYAKVGALYKLWFHITPGVTGYEGFEICPVSLRNIESKGWCACMGTAGTWDSLNISADEMKKALDDITHQVLDRT